MAVRKVLVVDDSETIRRIVATTLRVGGYEVALASDGSSAMNLLAAQDFDLVITDLIMPIMDGLRLISRIRAEDRLKGLPILVLTTEGVETERRASQEAGANEFLVKPFHPRRLLGMVQELLEHSTTSR